MISRVVGRQVSILDMMKAVFDPATAFLIVENGLGRGVLVAGKDDFLA